MSSSFTKAKVISNEEISEKIFKIKIKGKYNATAGQFYMLRSWNEEPFLSRPISVHSLNEHSIEFLYEVVGRGTELFSKLSENDSIELLGPLGNGFDIENIKGKIAILTGGIGIAPMYEVIKKLKGETIDIYAGFREESYSIEDMKEYAKNIYVATESGREGYKGYVIDKLDGSKYDYILTCGPTPMMREAKKLCEQTKTKLYMSLESHMACGVGACYGCTCDTLDGKKVRICKDGPVFLGKDVMLNE